MKVDNKILDTHEIGRIIELARHRDSESSEDWFEYTVADIDEYLQQIGYERLQELR